MRPLTDYVVVEDPEVITYDIEFTYYIPSNSTLSSVEIGEAVAAAVDKFVTRQAARLGRDINPSSLIGDLMTTGIKRVDLVSPAFTVLRDGSDDASPQIAAVGNITITNGGFEDE